MKHIKLFNESALPMPRVVNKEEAFELSDRERVNFKSTEIDTMCRILLVDKRPRFKEVTDKNWFSPDGTKLSRMAFDCYINRPQKLSKERIKLVNRLSMILRIFKYDDDWFVIEELSYDGDNRWLIADQFDEVKNYLETL
jgi:hypothetical protein